MSNLLEEAICSSDGSAPPGSYGKPPGSNPTMSRDWEPNVLTSPMRCARPDCACSCHKGQGRGSVPRGDLFQKRRKLMEAWVLNYATPRAGKVTAFS